MTITSDDYSAGTLGPIWSVEGPAGTASLDAGGGDSFLEISVPAGDFDLFNSEYNATRVLQDAVDTDFGIEASFLSEPAQSFQMQGILIEQDASNWIRFDLRAAGGQLKLFAATTTGAASSVRFDIVVAAGDAQFLRVTRTGDDWLMEYSADGTAWTAAGGFTHALTVTGVGPFAASTGSGGNGPGYTAQVDYFFNTAAPVVPEDPAVPNQAPTAAADALAVDEDGSATFDPAGNDNDPDGDAVVVAGVSAAPANGTAVLNADGSVTYTPDPDFHGPDAFDVIVTDGRGGFDTSTVSVTVAAVSDDPPVAADDTYQINVADGTVVADATTGVLANDLDPDGDLITASLLTGPTRGTLTFNADGSFDYTAGASFNGSDSFTYEISDPGGLTDTATVTIEDTNAPPALITSDDYSAGTLGPIWSVEGPAGTASLDAGGGDSFLEISVPAGDFDLFNSEYNATRVLQDAADTDFGIEASFLSEPAQSFQMQGILIEQDASNWIRFDLRAAGGQLKLFAATTTGAASSVRFDIVVAAGDAQFLRVTRTGDDWLMEYSADGTAWTAAGGFTHALTVTGVGPFAASTGSGGNGPGYTAQVDYFFNTAAPVVPEDPAVPNQAPTAAADALAVDEDGSATFDPAGNDNDPDGDAVVVAGVSAAPANGTAVLNADGSVTYTPGPDFHGPDAFDVVVTDGRGGFDTSTVSVTVAAVSDDPPVAADDTYQINVADGTVVADATTGVLANDLDPDGDLITASLLTGPTRGTLTFNADGSFDYTAGASFNGSDSFTYEISDPGGLTDTATVTIEDTNAPPQLVTGLSVFSKLVVNATMTATHAVAAADFDGDGDIDLVATAELDHTVAWFENDGSLGFTKHVIDGALSQAYPISIADIDGDGDVDVLAGGYGADQFVVYANDGLGNFTSQVVLSSNGAHSIFAFDVDGDGDQDLVTSSQDVHQAAWWENDGNENFAQHIIDGSLRRAKTAIPADIDGDGDVDIVGTSNASDQVVWYENDGSENFTKRIVDSNMDGAYYAIAADLDGDGDQDLAAVGQNADSIAWYRNDGSENFTKIVLDSTVNGARTVAATDIDGDGDIDLFATARDGNTLNWYQNDGDGNFTARFVDQNSDGVYGVEFSDINRDGLLDVLSAVRDTGEIVIHLQSKEHAADVTLGGTLQITTALLQATDPDDGPDDLTYTVLTVPLAGEVRLDGSPLSAGETFTQDDVDQNRLAYVHIDAAEVTDGFTFTLSDGGEGGVAPANGSFTFNITSTPPNAVDDVASTDEDQPVSIDVLANDGDSEGRAITIFSAGDPANGSVAIDDSGTPGNPGDDTIVYTPDQDFFGTDSFTYTISDGQGGSATATATVTVNPVNDAPVAVDDGVSTDEDTAVIVSVLGNDSDVDGDTLSISGTTGPANGSIVVNGNGTITYTPDADFNGTDSFTYTISDGQGGSATATATVTVNPVNDAPVAVDDGATTDEDTAVVVSVLGNDSDVDGDTLSISGTTGPANGSIVVNGNGTITYTPDADFNGTDSFTYTISDGQGGSATATATVTVNPVNDAPVAVDDGATTDEDTAVVVSVLGNDSDVDGDTLSISGTTGPANGSIVVNGNGTITYTPDADFNGTDSFTYTVSDGRGGSDTATATITVAPVNDAPVAVDDGATTDEDTAVVVSVLGNDSDVDGDTLSISGTTGPANGSIVVNGNGTITYTPDADFNGTDSFTYTISDGQGGSATATATVTVNPVNDAPVAVDDGVSTDEDTAVIVSVLGNDSDVDGDTLSISGTTGPANGSIVVNGNGTITYTPDADFNGTDSFTYTISDGQGGSATATATVTVAPVNDAPVAVDDGVSTDEDTAVIVSVLGNDSDVDGDTLSISGTTGPANGSIVVNGDGTITYTPDADFNGTDSFTYTVSDGRGGSDTATATVTVAPVNDAPVAVDDGASTDEDTAVVVSVLGNDSDVDGDTLSISGTTGPANGSIVVNGNGTITYTPDADFNGTDSFEVTVTDGLGGFDTSVANVTVTPQENGGNDDLTIIGSAKNDDLSGGAGRDTLQGAGGDDVLRGGANADRLDGGPGIDTASYSDAPAGLTVDLSDPRNNTGFAQGDEFVSIENLEGSSGADKLRGDSGNNFLHGGAGDDRLFGGLGDDILDAGTSDGGWQYLYGESGSDTYLYGRDGGKVFVLSGSGEGNAPDDIDRFVFEDLAFADARFSTHDYAGTGSASQGVALVVSWNDGTAGGQVRFGQEGRYIESFEFADGALFEKVTFAGASGGKTTGSDRKDLMLGGAGDDRLFGGLGDDILDAGTSDGGWQYLYGEGGSDTYLYGRDGGKVFVLSGSGEGNAPDDIDRFVFEDLAFADARFSTHDYAGTGSASQGVALVVSWNDGTAGGQVRFGQEGRYIESFEFADGALFEKVTFAGASGGKTTGSDRKDLMLGGAGDDRLFGGLGDDILDAGTSDGGWQYLYGEGGSDTYLYGRDGGKVFVLSGSGEGNAPDDIDRFVFEDLAFVDARFSTHDYAGTGSASQGVALVVSWNDGTAGGQVRFGQEGRYIESFEFADGALFEKVTFAGASGGKTTGSDRKDLMLGGAGDDRLFGGLGDDILDAGTSDGGWQYLYGEGGSDTYLYGRDGGKVFVLSGSGEGNAPDDIDRFVFEDLAFADARFSTHDYAGTGSASQGVALVVSWNDGTAGGQVRFGQEGRYIESFEFADGAIMTSEDILAVA